MIARIWRGAVRAEDAAAYAAYAEQTGIEGYRRTAGNRGAWLLWRTEGDRAEFITMSLWESRAAIEAFAGRDIGTASSTPRTRSTSSSGTSPRATTRSPGTLDQPCRVPRRCHRADGCTTAISRTSACYSPPSRHLLLAGWR